MAWKHVENTTQNSDEEQELPWLEEEYTETAQCSGVTRLAQPAHLGQLQAHTPPQIE